MCIYKWYNFTSHLQKIIKPSFPNPHSYLYLKGRMLSQLSACTGTESAQWFLRNGLTWSFFCGHTAESAISEFLPQPSERFHTFPHGTGIYLKAVQFHKWRSDQNVINRSGCYPQAGSDFIFSWANYLTHGVFTQNIQAIPSGDKNKIFRWQETPKGKNHALPWW